MRNVLIGAGLLVGVSICLGGWLIDLALRVVPVPALLSSPADDKTYIAARLARQRLPDDAARDGVRLVLLGSSALREAFLSSDAELSAALSEREGHAVTVQTMSSRSQSLRETLVLADNLPADGRCVVVVGVSPLRFQHAPDSPIGIPLRSRALARFDEEQGLPRTVLGELARYYHWPWLSRWSKARFRRDGDEVHHVERRFLKARSASEPYLRAEWIRLAAKNAVIVEHLPVNALALERIVETTTARGCATVLLEQVHHPVLLELQRPIEDTYRSHVTRIAASHGIVYLDYREHLEFQAQDFADHLHLGRSGKRRFEAWLLRELTRPGPVRDLLGGEGHASRVVERDPVL